MRFAPRAMNNVGDDFPAASTGPRIAQILLDNFLRRTPQGNNPFLVALASHQHVPEFELQVFQLDVDDLRHAQRSGIKNFEDGSVAQAQRLRYAIVFRARRPPQHALDLVGRQRLRQHLPLPRTIDIQRRIGLDVAVQQQVLVEMPQRRKLARHAPPINSIRQQLHSESRARPVGAQPAQRAFASAEILNTVPNRSDTPKH